MRRHWFATRWTPGAYDLVLRSTDGRYVRRVRLSIEAGETSVFRFMLSRRDEVLVPDAGIGP